MALKRLTLRRFTAFDDLEFPPAPGINAIIGTNGTGKTHLMKVAYAACDVSKTGTSFAEKLIRLLLPSGRALGRLVKRQRGSSRCLVEVQRRERRTTLKLSASFSNHASVAKTATVRGATPWSEPPLESVYIPVEEMLANARGLRSLYSQREVHLEEVHADVLDRAYRPALRGSTNKERGELLSVLQDAMAGEVEVKNDEFFLRSQEGSLEFSLLAEGMRKLGLLWLLIQNGTLRSGSVLFWDEPETNLHPRLLGPLADILLSLREAGIQIFLATHDYAVLKELDLRSAGSGAVMFHSLYREKSHGRIAFDSSKTYDGIHPNMIGQVFTNLYDREVERSLADNANSWNRSLPAGYRVSRVTDAASS